MSSVANRISQIADEQEIEFEDRGADQNDIRAIAEVLEIELEYSGNDDNLLDILEAEIAELEE